MAILIGVAVVSTIAALLWLTQHNIYLHIAVFSAAIGAPFLFGHQFGLSGGFLIAIGVMIAELAIIWLSCRQSLSNKA